MPNPEYLHVLTNHAPVYLLLAALVPILIGVVVRSRASVNAGLLLIVLAALGTAVVMWSGEAAMESAEAGELAAHVDGPGEAWMHTHAGRADLTAKVVYVTGAFAAFSMLVGIGSDKVRAIFAMLCVLAALVSAGMLGWTAQAGGLIMHTEFRDAANPYPEPWNEDGEPSDEHEDQVSDVPDDTPEAVTPSDTTNADADNDAGP